MITRQDSSRTTEMAQRARVRGALDWSILIGLGIVVAVDAAAQLIEGAIIPPVVMTMGAYLVCIAIVATGWRWAMLFPLVLCTLGIIADFASGYPQFALTHPSDNRLAFVTFAIIYPLLVMVIVASATKLAQTLRHEAIHAPRWLRPLQAALLGLSLGALLIGVAAKPQTASGSAAGGAGTKVVHLGAMSFAPDIVALHTGDTLTVIDDAAVPHILANGSWSASNQAQPATESGAPVIQNVELNNNTRALGPFTTPGTYHIYCTVHPGMNLTVIVQ